METAPPPATTARTEGVMANNASGHILRFVRFDNVTDNVPRPDWRSWPKFVEEFSRHEVRASKDGPGVGFAIYKPGATRGTEGVVEVTALVADIDPDTLPPEKQRNATPKAVGRRLAGFAHMVCSTWGEHGTSERPSFRVQYRGLQVSPLLT